MFSLRRRERAAPTAWRCYRGGQIFGQAPTLYTIPIVFLHLNRLRLRISRAAHAKAPSL